MAKSIKIHPQLHDVFGEQQSIFEFTSIIIFGVVATTILFWLHNDFLTQIKLCKLILAMVFILDIAAGCIANFTRSTNNFYSQRPKHRWIFISIHFHIIIVAYALGVDIVNALYIWGYTIISAVIVNSFKTSQFQIFIGGLLLSCGVTFGLLLPDTHPIMAVVQSLFMLKVIFSFSVDHYPAAKEK